MSGRAKKVRNAVLGDPAKVRNLRQAQRALNSYTEPGETDEYHRLNDKVIEAQRNVPGWRRT